MSFRVVSPSNREELLQTIAELQSESFRFGAGYTDLLLEIRKAPAPGLTVINLARLIDAEFTAIKMDGSQLRIGCLSTVAQVHGNEAIGLHYPVLRQAAGVLASRQIREVATVGGNLCTASPAGDVACALVALNATCDILRADGTARTVPITEFFTGVRKTVLKRDELLRSVFIPPNRPGVRLHSGFIKVGIRRSMECSVVSLAYHLQISPQDTVVAASVAIGSVAPTIRFTKSACDFLAGKSLRSFDSDAIQSFADLVVSSASPISDRRASAQYRRRALYNISKCVLETLTKIEGK